MEINFKDFINGCERARKRHAENSGNAQYKAWDQDAYQELLRKDPKRIEDLERLYREQFSFENNGLILPYIRFADDLKPYFAPMYENTESKAKLVEAEVVDNHPVVPSCSGMAVVEDINSNIPVHCSYVQNNFYVPKQPFQMPQYTAEDRKKHKSVTDEYNVIALVEDFQRKIPYVVYHDEVYLFLQIFEGDPESVAYVRQSHNELVGRINWFYKQELGKIGTAKIVNEVAKYIETDITHVVQELDYAKIRSRVQCLGRYFDLNVKRWFNNNPRDFFISYVNVRGVDVQNWSAPTPVFEKMLQNICRGDEATLSAILEMMATCISQTFEYKSAFFLQGYSDSGKSALIHCVELFYSPQFKKHKSIQELMVDKELSELDGVSLDTKEELSSGMFNADETAFFKMLTSGDSTELTSGKKYALDVTFINTTHFIFATNLPISFANFTQAVKNRIVCIGLRNIIPPNQQIRNLKELLKSELPGIVSILLPVLLKLWQNHFAFTQNCNLNDYFEESLPQKSSLLPIARQIAVQDTEEAEVLSFINEKLKCGTSEDKISMAGLFESFNEWARNHGSNSFTDQGHFTKAFKDNICKSNLAENPSLDFKKASFRGYANPIAACFGIAFAGMDINEGVD